MLQFAAPGQDGHVCAAARTGGLDCRLGHGTEPGHRLDRVEHKEQPDDQGVMRPVPHPGEPGDLAKDEIRDDEIEERPEDMDHRPRDVDRNRELQDTTHLRRGFID